MTTMNDCLFLKDKKKSSGISHKGESHDRYSNLNLNQNHKFSILIPVQSFSKTNKDKHYATFKLTDSTVSENHKGKGKLETWNKSPDLCSNTLKLNGEEKVEKQWKKDDSFNSESTLSLHIAAFENSVATLFGSDVIKCESKKENFIASTFVTQKTFEFPRQQNDNATEPEVSQFRASQQLLNPNEGSTNVHQQHQPKSDTKIGAAKKLYNFLAKKLVKNFQMSTSQAPTTERFHVLAQLEHLQSRYTGCGHADSNRWDWLTNQHRDTSASLIGHPDHLSYIAVAKNYSRERARIELLDKMISPCGPPPKRNALDDI